MSDDKVRAEGEVRFPVYDGGRLREVLFVIEGEELPLTIGATFTCRVVGLTREVTER